MYDCSSTPVLRVLETIRRRGDMLPVRGTPISWQGTWQDAERRCRTPLILSLLLNDDDSAAQNMWFHCLVDRVFGPQRNYRPIRALLDPNLLTHPHQIISCCREGKDPSNFQQPAMFHFAQQCVALHPVEALFDAFSLLLTDGITGVPPWCT